MGQVVRTVGEGGIAADLEGVVQIMKVKRKRARLALALAAAFALGAVAVVPWGNDGHAQAASVPKSTACSGHEGHSVTQHLACLGATSTAAANSGSSNTDRDVMQLSDEPGNWFRSERTGESVTSVPVGGRVDFVAGELTNTRHTATLVIKPVGSQLATDQDQSRSGGVASATFDRPGVYLFLCKVHPYMTGVVAVTDAAGNVPPVTAAQLPFIGHLGVDSLPAGTVLSVLPAIAATDAQKLQKWDIGSFADEFRPAVSGVGEVWIDTQFESVPGQADERGVPKPGTITVVDAATFGIEREVSGLDPQARGRWNNPHNMWTDTRHRVIYNGHWFGRWHNKIARANGDVLTTVDVGDAPTHTVTNPNERSSQHGHLTLPLSARDNFLRLVDPSFGAVQNIADSDPTGQGRNHPHAQWLTSDGSKMVVPNVFKGLGVAGSIGIVNPENGAIQREIRAPAIAMPVATGIQGVSQGNKAYVANIVSGQVSVVDLNTNQHVKDIPVTFTPNCLRGPTFNVFHTLQVPIQLPVSPDGRFVSVAVLSLTTVPRSCTGSPDHVSIIDTRTDEVVKIVGIPVKSGTAAGTHGANYGAKKGGGYYVHVANQWSNMLSVVDVDPNGDGEATDAAVVGRILLANGMPGGPRVTDGVGGQGIKPLPNVYDGWVQDTVAVAAETEPEVQGWIAQLTPCQKNPSAAGCTPAGPGR
jgi:YVTN family beta-propeller protein